MEPHLLRTLLTVDPLDQAEILAGAEHVGGRRVSWVTVIHWPAAEFARPDELVLTTGVGCSEDELAEFVGALAARGIAALCISRPFDQPVPEAVRAAARGAALPLLRLPWALCFTDVTRAVLDALVSARYEARLDGPGGLQQGCNRALLEGESFDGIAAALERCLGRPALVFDRAFRIVGRGVAGEGAVRGVDAATLAGDRDGPAEEALIELLAGERPCAFRDLPAAGLGLSWGLRATARGRTLGFVQVIVGGDGDEVPGLAARALAIAAEAVALEMLRLHDNADGARSDLLRDLLAGADIRAAADRARSLGIDLGALHDLVVAEPAGITRIALERLRHSARRHDLDVLEAHLDGMHVLVAPAPAVGHHTGLPHLVGQAVADDPVAGVAWGLADRSAPLAAARRMLSEALRALRVARALASADPVADPRRLGPYMLLGALGEDDYAAGVAEALVQPLVAYDERTGRNLVETLEVFLAEKCNTSSSARLLFLNRHSLLYRLRKIEELTGRSLEHAQDRFLLELSLRLHRYRAQAHTSEEAVHAL